MRVKRLTLPSLLLIISFGSLVGIVLLHFLPTSITATLIFLTLIAANSAVLMMAVLALRRNHTTLHSSEVLYRAFASHFPNGTILLFDRNLRFVLVDGQGLSAVGLCKKDVEGKTLWEVMPPEISAIVEPTYRKALQGEMDTSEITIADRIHHVYTLPVRDETDTITGGMVMTQDITERKRTEDALRESQRFVQKIAETLPDALYLYDLVEHRSLYANHQITKILGYGDVSLGDFDGSRIQSLIHPEDLAQMPVYRARLLDLEDNAVLENECRWKHASGTWHWMLTREMIFQRDKNGAPLQIIGIAQDVTRRKLAEHQALELNIERERGKLLTDFIEAISHDLRTPLSIINTSLYLSRKADSPEKLERHLTAIEDQVTLLASIIAQLNAMSQLDRQADFKLEQVEVNHLLQHTVRLLQPKASTKQLAITLDLQAELPIIQGDPRYLHNALGNLLENAIRYTPEGGKISLRSAQSDEEIVLEVRDTGIGINPTKLPLIFDRFYKGNTARTGNGTGAGLGLAMVKKIVEQHKGRIEVESEEGKGSLFRIWLPISPSSLPISA